MSAPRLETAPHHVKVVFSGVAVAESGRGLLLHAEGEPPVAYVPLEDLRMHLVDLTSRTREDPHLGVARLYDVIVVGKRVRDAAWSFEEPKAGFEALADHVAFDPAKAQQVLVDGKPLAAGAAPRAEG